MTDSLSGEITIAVTVYDRRDYIVQAIESALGQTIPVKVVVVEDCGPDAGLKSFVQGKFGNRVEYFRNPRRRGLFDNWNACLELCETPFLSILHDDDFLHPEFIAAMQELIGHAPGSALYFGRTDIVDERGEKTGPTFPPITQSWRKVALIDFAQANPLLFPGQLFRVDAARAVGGFRPTSFYCGDYEMWAKLAARFGAAQTARRVASVRTHREWGRGTARVERSGKIRALTFVQQKRIGLMLKAQGVPWTLNRKESLRQFPLPSKFLLRNAALFSPRMLEYNHRLFLDSTPPNWRYASLQKLARLLGPTCLKWISKAYRSLANPSRV